MHLFISAASDISGRASNLDAYGFSDGCETICSQGQNHISHQKEYEGINEFMSVIADGVSGAEHTERPQDDAAVSIVRRILDDLFDEYSLDQSMDAIADEINETMIHISNQWNRQLAAALSVIGIYPDEVRILNMGDAAVLRFHHGKAHIITPLSNTSRLSEYAGNTSHSGHQMADIYRFRPEKDDLYVLATDGLIHAFTDVNGLLRTDDILNILETNQYDAQTLVNTALKTSRDNISACVIRIRELS
jgi:serine/threonine protein phosphatase PrpC